MGRYSDDFKKMVVERYMKGDITYDGLCEEYDIHARSSLQMWIDRYKEHGEENFCVRHGSYAGEFKIEVVEYMHEHGTSYKETAVHFNIPGPHTVKDWEKIYNEEGKEALLKHRRGKVYSMGKSTGQDKDGKTGSGKTKEKMVTLTFRKPPENETLEEQNERLTRENVLLKKSETSSQIPERALIEAITEMREKYPLRVILDDIGMPRSTYYYKLAKYNKEDKYFELKCEITAIFEENKGRYGYRRVTYELQLRGRKVNHKLVQRLMQEMGLKGNTKVVKYNSYKGDVGRIAPNIIARNFHSEAPRKKMGTDLSQLTVCETKFFLSPVLDMYNGEIIGYDISEHPNMDQIMRMLDKAFGDVSDAHGAILHSDQGWQYQNPRYQEYLKEKHITQSMSRKGNCLDDAIVEEFFSALKTEFFYTKHFSSKEEFIKELDDYIYYYNNVRIKTRLKMSPVQYRLLHFPET